MSRNKLGTIVRLPDGRTGTVVFNGLTGIGIRWGEHAITPEIRELFRNTCGGAFGDDGSAETVPNKWYPEAMLREPSESLERSLGLPCVCHETKAEVIKAGVDL